MIEIWHDRLRILRSKAVIVLCDCLIALCEKIESRRNESEDSNWNG